MLIKQKLKNLIYKLTNMLLFDINDIKQTDLVKVETAEETSTESPPKMDPFNIAPQLDALQNKKSPVRSNSPDTPRSNHSKNSPK